MVAIASGAMGAITAVGTATPEQRTALRKDLTDEEQRALSICESCAQHINRNKLRIDPSMKDSKVVQICEKISGMEGSPKLISLIKKFLKSPKLDASKLRVLAEMCEKDGSDDSELCRAVKETVASSEELIGGLSVEDIRGCAEDVSQAYRNLKFKTPKDTWATSKDFDWGSDDDVKSGVSAYKFS